MTARSSNHVYVAGFTYKQAITGTLGITLLSNFLPIELLIYGGKTVLEFPKSKFPEIFSLNENLKHFSITEVLFKLLEDIIISYVKDEQEKLKLEPSQSALIFDVFSGKMTSPVNDKLKRTTLKKNHVRVSPNMTNLFQRLDLTVNRSAKAFMKRKFTGWYLDKYKYCLSTQISNTKFM